MDFSICKNCRLPIFFDWRGAHHVTKEGALAVTEFGQFDTRIDWSKTPCGRPEEENEEG